MAESGDGGGGLELQELPTETLRAVLSHLGPRDAALASLPLVSTSVLAAMRRVRPPGTLQGGTVKRAARMARVRRSCCWSRDATSLSSSPGCGGGSALPKMHELPSRMRPLGPSTP